MKSNTNDDRQNEAIKKRKKRRDEMKDRELNRTSKMYNSDMKGYS